MEAIKKEIETGACALGIEFGSTRIKAVLVDSKNGPIASGSHEWENRFENGLWTYTAEDVVRGLQDCYAKLKADVKEKYGIVIGRVGAIGISAMMHGYMAFNGKDELLVPFRTWRNNCAQDAAEKPLPVFLQYV